MSDWGEPRTYLRVNRVSGLYQGVCGECGEVVGWKRTHHCWSCGTVFTEITSPFDKDHDFCRRVRPDLTYVSLEWG